MSDATTDMYDTLENTARFFIDSCAPDPPDSNKPNVRRILSNFTEDFTMTWGHDFFVQHSMANLQGEKSGREFVDHMAGMASKLQTWSIEVVDIIVDVREKRAMARADFHMTPRGTKTIINDIVFLMSMDDSGEKLIECTEFVDPAASAEIAKALRAID